jgi:hypothetical protein
MPDVETDGAPQTSPSRDRLRRLVPRSSRVRATLLVLAALLAFLLAFVVGRATASSQAPPRTAPPLVRQSEAVEVRGLPYSRALPTLAPKPVAPKKPARSKPGAARRPVVIVGEG